MSIEDKEIQQVLAPPGTSVNDQQELYDFIPDILSVPGASANPCSSIEMKIAIHMICLNASTIPTPLNELLPETATTGQNLCTECGMLRTMKNLSLLTIKELMKKRTFSLSSLESTTLIIARTVLLCDPLRLAWHVRVVSYRSSLEIPLNFSSNFVNTSVLRSGSPILFCYGSCCPHPQVPF